MRNHTKVPGKKQKQIWNQWAKLFHLPPVMINFIFGTTLMGSYRVIESTLNCNIMHLNIPYIAEFCAYHTHGKLLRETLFRERVVWSLISTHFFASYSIFFCEYGQWKQIELRYDAFKYSLYRSILCLQHARKYSYLEHIFMSFSNSKVCDILHNPL